MRTVGNNPAEQLTAVLLCPPRPRNTGLERQAAGRDRAARIRTARRSTDAILTSDPPPWWRVHKKNALFYNGMARGDHRGTMALATASASTTSSRQSASTRGLRDIQAFVATRASAEVSAQHRRKSSRRAGARCFERDCAGCHGTYASDAARRRARHLSEPADPARRDRHRSGGRQRRRRARAASWSIGTTGRSTARSRPSCRTIRSPATCRRRSTASGRPRPTCTTARCPTVELVLNSAPGRPSGSAWTTTRPTSTRRRSVGRTTNVDYAQADAPPEERKYVYDTGYFSQSNAGHDFRRSPERQRAARGHRVPEDVVSEPVGAGRGLVGALVAASILAGVSEARAFCRTTTCNERTRSKRVWWTIRAA